MSDYNPRFWTFDVEQAPKAPGFDNGFIVSIDGQPVIFALSAHETEYPIGTYFERTIEIDGKEHTVSLIVDGVRIKHE